MRGTGKDVGYKGSKTDVSLSSQSLGTSKEAVGGADHDNVHGAVSSGKGHSVRSYLRAEKPRLTWMWSGATEMRNHLAPLRAPDGSRGLTGDRNGDWKAWNVGPFAYARFCRLDVWGRAVTLYAAFCRDTQANMGGRGGGPGGRERKVCPKP